MPTVVAAMRAGRGRVSRQAARSRRASTNARSTVRDRAVRAPNGDAVAPPPTLDVLVGRDPRMIDIFKLIGQAAATRATVLIRGESGTGKELVARAIHAQLGRVRRAVRAGQLRRAAGDAARVGAVRPRARRRSPARRATGADASRSPDSGTIFLDEIGDTSLEFQTKLLRVLQDREYQPVGSEETEQHRGARHRRDASRSRGDDRRAARSARTCTTDCASSRSCCRRSASAPATFRCSREHTRRDAPAARWTLTPVVLSDEALRMLTAHTWPGNVRELENCLVRAIVLARGGVIRPEHLILSTADERPRRVVPLAGGRRARSHRARVRRDGAPKTRTAEILGISRPRLDRLLRKHGLS